jgi:N-acetylmuramoyl-L-alanine amidase
MWRVGFAASLIGMMAAIGQPAFAADKPSGDVMRVRLGGDANQTRIVIELDKSTAGELVTRDDDTRAAVLALGDVQLDKSMTGTGKGLVSGWKLDSLAGSVRLHISYNGNAKVYRRFLLPPADGVSVYRYVVDVVPATGPAPDAASDLLGTVTAQPQDAADDAVTEKAVAHTHTKKIIIIDAGHGGKDPGAHGAFSLEKDCNLAAAKSLRDALERTGRYKVIMTRDTDSFVDLPARVRIARTANADLFISLHSDSGGSGQTSGASIYTLSDSGTERAAKKAMVKGDWSLADVSSPDQTVQRILVDLTQRATKNRSATFAQLVMDHIGDSTPLLKANLRQAGFVVLLAPDVPAVLLEMGYVNNDHDERMLNDPHHREVMAGQITDAIDQYFANSTRYASMAGLP